MNKVSEGLFTMFMWIFRKKKITLGQKEILANIAARRYWSK